MSRKRSISSIALRKGADIDDIIMSEDYYISNLDLFTLANKYQFPIIIIAGKPLLENGEERIENKTIVSYLQDDVDFYYIIHPSMPIPKIYHQNIV